MSSLRVLIAISNKPLLSSYCENLARDGFEVTAATDGLWCMSLLRSMVPQALIIDPFLPWGGGDGVVAWMREQRRLAGVPVLAFSSQDSPFRPMLAALPADLYLPAPPSPNLLARTVRWLAQTRLSRIEAENSADPFVRMRDFGANEALDTADLRLVASSGLFAS